jgi:hypothetical protein
MHIIDVVAGGRVVLCRADVPIERSGPPAKELDHYNACLKCVRYWQRSERASESRRSASALTQK